MNNMIFSRNLPKKHMAAAALLLNEQNEILIVNPVYGELWLLPGGIVEEDESPRQACMREVKEELGLDITVGRLLCVDYKVRQGMKEESIQFVFFGGVLEEETVGQIQLQMEELSEARFVNLEEAMELLNPKSARRMPFTMGALRQGITAYLEDGREVE